jgi:hypothetical protein
MGFPQPGKIGRFPQERREQMMIQITAGGLICLLVAILCILAVLMLVITAKIAASQGGKVGLFTLAITFLCLIAGLLLASAT